MTVKVERKLAEKRKKNGYIEIGLIVWLNGEEECVLIK